jgi:hypothetical protein
MSRAEFESFTSDKSTIEFNDLDEPIPKGLPTPATYKMFLMPVGIKRELKVAGTDKKIYLPDESIDANKWLNAIGRIVALGPACFKHPKYKEMGLEEKDFPKVGDLILYSGRAPQRMQFRGTPILIVHDDHWFGKIEDPETIPYFKFYV